MHRSLHALTAALCLAAGAAQADFTLTILHTNDFHDRFEPISKFDGPCAPGDNEKGDCFGGIARIATAVAEARAKGGVSILLDAGDQAQGGLFYTQYKNKPAAEFMTRLGYQAMAVGNHEFDDGPQILSDFVDRVNFPVLMANADVSQEPLLKGKVAKSAVIEAGGQKIGIVGLTPQDNPDLASPGKNIVFTDPAPAAQAEIDALTAAGIDKIILLSHSGYVLDQKLAAELKGVDVIVGGHSHTYLSSTDPKAEGRYPTMVGGVPVVTAYAYSRYLGELTVTFDDAGKVVKAEGAPRLLDASVKEDPAAIARVAELAKPLDELRKRVVAEAAAGIEGGRDICRQAECPMGNLVAEAQLDRVKDQGVTISLANSGGLRASIDAGPVTMGEVLTVLPFQNTLSTFQVKGAVLQQALENGVSQYEEKAGRFLQVAGLTYSFDLSQPVGQRVSQVKVAEGGGFVPLDPEKDYLVVSNNYVRQGGDGFKMFVNADKAYDFGPDLAEVVAAYLASHAPYAPVTDGRIVKKP